MGPFWAATAQKHFRTVIWMVLGALLWEQDMYPQEIFLWKLFILLERKVLVSAILYTGLNRLG